MRTMLKLAAMAAMAAAVAFTACQEDEPKDDTPAVVSVTGVSLSDTAKTLAVGDTLRLAATVAPDKATNKKLSWASDKTSVATVDQSGKVTAVAEGEAVITVTTEDGSKKATCAVTVKKKATVVEKPVAVTEVKLSETSWRLTVGEEFTLVATVLPDSATNKNVSWASDKTNIATVDQNGKVTAVAAGEAVITVTTEDGSKKAACNIAVKEKTVEEKPVAVTEVKLSETSWGLTVGENFTLVATVLPDSATNKNVSWSSDKTNIATVDQTGKVTAVAAGEATITVTTEDGSKTAACTVTVQAEAVAVTGVSLDKATADLVVGESFSVTLTATVAPGDAANKSLQWSSSNEARAVVYSMGANTAMVQFAQGATNGDVTITATTVDGGFKATCVVTVIAEIPVTGISLSETTKNMFKGDVTNYPLTASLEPLNATNFSIDDIEWESSAPAVVSVATPDYPSQASLTAHDFGTATITAKVGEFTATCVVTVGFDGTTWMAYAPTGAQDGYRKFTFHSGYADRESFNGRAISRSNNNPYTWNNPTINVDNGMFILTWDAATGKLTDGEGWVYNK